MDSEGTPAQAGFTVEGTFYPWPAGFRFGDTVLVCEVTGLSWDDFSRLQDAGAADPRVIAGMVATAVWQANPKWPRQRVREYVERLDIGALDVPEQEPPGGDAGPPAPTGNGSPGPSSPESTPAGDSPASG